MSLTVPSLLSHIYFRLKMKKTIIKIKILNTIQLLHVAVSII